MERWAVGGLCAERLETQVAADSSAFLMCESARNMERMLFWVDDDQRVGSKRQQWAGRGLLEVR